MVVRFILVMAVLKSVALSGVLLYVGTGISFFALSTCIVASLDLALFCAAYKRGCCATRRRLEEATAIAQECRRVRAELRHR